MQEFPMGSASTDQETIHALQQDLQKLHETLSPASSNEILFDELKETMTGIANRIASLETNVQEMMSGADTAMPASVMTETYAEPQNVQTAAMQPEPVPIPGPAVAEEPTHFAEVGAPTPVTEQEIAPYAEEDVEPVGVPEVEAVQETTAGYEQEVAADPYPVQPTPEAQTMKLLNIHLTTSL